MTRLPLVTVRVVIDAGAATEQPAVAGLATLTMRSLAEGTTRLDAGGLAEAFERLGGPLSIFVSWDEATLQTTVVHEHFAAMVGLLGEVVRTASLPEREVARLREERVAELLELRAEPRGLADQSFEAALYASGSRFALPDGGSLDTVRLLTAEQVREFHKTRLQPGATTVIVVGDVTAAEAVENVTHSFGDWEGNLTGMVATSARTAHEHRLVHVLARPEAPQTELRIGHIGLPRRHPDYFAVVVMNAILGGVFNSRINLNLRERHAYTYGASSAFEWRRVAGPFEVSTAVATEATAPAVREIINELERLREAPPGSDELSLVISYLDGVFPIRFETTEAVAGGLASVKVFDLSDDYYDTYRARIRAVSAADVLQAARTHIRPDQLQVVAVGDPRIGQDLGALGLGPVVFREADATPADGTEYDGRA